MSEEQDYKRLVDFFHDKGCVAVAFSGGVDSSLLLAAATDAVGDKAIGVTICSPLSSPGEQEEAKEFARLFHAQHLLVQLDELSNPLVRSNPANRCYHCKRMRFEALIDLAKKRGFELLVEGSCIDDLYDYRPGLKAVRELGIVSPLLLLDFSKDDVRRLSKYRQLPNWSRPSNSCLATRVPFGQALEAARLQKISRAETMLGQMGFKQVRVRDFGDMAIVEVLPDSIARICSVRRQGVLRSLEGLGFERVCIDLAGYRTGSMNTGISLGQGKED